MGRAGAAAAYDELLRQIGAALIGVAPQGWRRIDLIARIADPLWNPPIPAAYFERDLAAYPRPVETIPGWLRRTMEQARTERKATN